MNLLTDRQFEAVEKFADGMVESEIERAKKTRPEQFAKLTQADIEDYRQRKVAEAKVMAEQIINFDADIVRRINIGMLHPDNKFTRGLFMGVTGIDLPPQSGKTQDVIYAHPVWGKLVLEHQEAEKLKREQAQAEKIAKEQAGFSQGGWWQLA